MKGKNPFSLKEWRAFRYFSRIKVSPLCWALILWLAAACAPQAPPAPPPAPIYPTRVITSDGVAFMVHRFRLPGTRQEITLRYDDAKQWVPLNLVHSVRFTGEVKDGYRKGEIFLSSGERMKAEIFVNTVVEGTTDLGYWNMTLSRIDSLDLGSD